MVIVGEELGGTDTDDIGNLGDLPKFVFIDEECGNLVVANKCQLCKKYFTREYFFNNYVEYGESAMKQ